MIFWWINGSGGRNVKKTIVAKVIFIAALLFASTSAFAAVVNGGPLLS
jgi:hypothetical protein